MSDKRKLIIDYIFISILWILIGILFYDIYFTGFNGHLNNVLAFILLVVVTLFKIFKPGRYNWFLITLMFLGAFQIVNFNILRITFKAGVSENNSFSIGFDFIPFLLLVIYCVVRRDLVRRIITTIFKGSKDERVQQEDRMVTFYYDKFNTCSQEELTGILKKFGDYPFEAQIALNKIKAERQAVKID